jgi:cobalt-precorrin-5B (C1)-methyltransferase
MILILGGTTEGRLAAKVCDEASKPFFYSTKGGLQEVSSANGIRLTGGMDEDSMANFCVSNSIRLLVDAAHPFAIGLHQTVAQVSEKLHIPVIRYERKYPERDKDLIWCDSYQDAINYLEENKLESLLALTGTNTIVKLKPYWLKHDCWFRILDREESRLIAHNNGLPSSRILYYHPEQENDITLFEQLNPKAIITKESGDSGGFSEKVSAARQLAIPILVVKRPELSTSFISVYGENGLRKTIERIFPDFFDLKTGYTTGTCATAATKAAFEALLSGEVVQEVSLTLPSGEWVAIPVASVEFQNEEVTATVVKDAGDDPDVTHGHEIRSTVCLNGHHKGVQFLTGKGVGIVTLPGLGIDIGQPAINKIPRMMMRREIFKVMRHYLDKLPNGIKSGVDVTVSVPKGEELANKTFNPKLGIVGGISIIGTSGIVKPFSSDAFIGAIRREMQVAKALGCEQVVINSGAKSERYVKTRFSELPGQAFIHYGNFIGETIKIAAETGFRKVSMGIMIGKAVKLAEGYLDTHSKKVVMNKEFLKGLALQAGWTHSNIGRIDDIVLARQLWEIAPTREDYFFKLLASKCRESCFELLPAGHLEVMLVDEEGQMVE